MKIEIRGIIKTFSKNSEEIEIVVRDATGENYQSAKYPPGKPLRSNEVIQFLAEKMNLPVENFLIPSHLVHFFETEESKEKEKK